MSSLRRVLSGNTCGARERDVRKKPALCRDNYKRHPKAKVSDLAVLFSGSPENPAVSKEMVARKIEKKYCRAIYRIITAHRNPMTRSC